MGKPTKKKNDSDVDDDAKTPDTKLGVHRSRNTSAWKRKIRDCFQKLLCYVDEDGLEAYGVTVKTEIDKILDGLKDDLKEIKETLNNKANRREAESYTDKAIKSTMKKLAKVESETSETKKSMESAEKKVVSMELKSEITDKKLIALESKSESTKDSVLAMKESVWRRIDNLRKELSSLEDSVEVLQVLEDDTSEKISFLNAQLNGISTLEMKVDSNEKAINEERFQRIAADERSVTRILALEEQVDL